MSLTHKVITDYMQDLENKNTSTKSFFRFNIMEIQGAIRGNIIYPAMAMESPEGNFSDSSVNNSLDKKIFAFSILDKPEKGNFDDENDKLDQCEIIGKQFLSRMRYDSFLPSSPIYNCFNLSDVEYHKVGPIYTDRLFGYRFEIHLDDKKTNMQINPSEWTDLDSPCP